ncbi:hypothetical protein CGRA01v4_10300 [Colletotrichum graminicola]|uniref:Uncharacterized protein n=1 Tax=Colletotrichum graminicola (strain M1.001 / M2 / FGSC 10212) TaxID=645133 RepID=E3QD79_COLGM|nr:uncharacterized protein GLRG_03995 [Colletotrichum graminicola M1.001]EFQ28851.1 hypothetical protein GLRG_03995 [Colletotrichum graminicola M1.001]WDK19013.1 hypothetical protein CGRA01v4_10300 [Colletotrichum graminicola]
MALAVDTPHGAPSTRVLVDEADDDIAFESSRQAWPTTQNNPADGTAAMPKDRTIHFNVTTLGGDNRVIVTSNDTHDINWTANSSVKITNAIWLGNMPGHFEETKELFPNEAGSSEQSSSTSYSSSDLGQPSTRAKRGEGVNLYGHSLSLPVHELYLKYGDQSMYINMYISLMWTHDDRSGTSRSGVFTVLNSSVPSTDYDATVQRIKYLTAGDDNGDQLNGFETDGVPTESVPGGEVETSTLPPPTATTFPPNPAIGQNTGSNSGGSSLSSGTIAGIVIGSVFGLSLIVFLGWFFLRQRRRADHVSNSEYGSGHGPHKYLADKEAHARVTESPHPPYSDDRQQPQQQLEQHHYLHQGGSGAAVGAAERSPLTPYGEEGHVPITGRSMEDMTRSGVPSSTPNAATNVSHLIEDGMTEEDIRQLEDEERALDDAIEQAGQGQRRG